MKEKLLKRYAYYYYRFITSQDSARFDEYRFKCQAISSFLDKETILKIQDELVKRFHKYSLGFIIEHETQTEQIARLKTVLKAYEIATEKNPKIKNNISKLLKTELK